MSRFTEEQRKCIEFFPNYSESKQHLIIEAGAGAGKTSVLMERVKWLILNKKIKIDPGKLFIVTFSNDAALQIKAKIEHEFSQDSFLNESINLIHVSTIDSFFSDLVNSIYPSWWEKNQPQNNKYFMPPKLQLITEESVCEDLKKAIQKYFIQNNMHEKELYLVLDYILAGALKSGFMQNTGTFEYLLKALCNETFLATTPENIRIAAKFMHPATTFLLHEFHSIAKNEYYNRIIRGEFTYADRTLFLKEQLPNNCPIKVQELIVDEYQDTNHIQHDILFNIVSDNNARMVVVGDPKQSIYGFRNASVDVFQSLKNNSLWQHIELKKNFRSKPLLLDKINKLSKIVFQWRNPKFPEAFKESYFYQAALKKYIPDNALEAGISENSDDQSISQLNIVTCSLNPKRVHENNTHILEDMSNISLEEYSLQSYTNFIKFYQEKYDITWNKMVILCEENSDILKFNAVLLKQNIPTNITVNNAKDTPFIFEYNVGLALAKHLVNEHDTIDLYTILISPLTNISYSEIEKYFLTSAQDISDNILKILNLIKTFQILAKDNFFLAWQRLRWQFLNFHTSDETKNLAIQFLIKMDDFSQALHYKLSSPTFRKSIEEKIYRLIENTHSEKQLENILPKDLDQWNIDSSHEKQLDKSFGIEIKTVHKAKGLEWPHVFFYPKNGKIKSLGKFVTALSERFIDVTWLQDDVESMSVVKRIPNKNFLEDDFYEEFNTKGVSRDKFFFPELRKHAESDFERQRVFYTAFTRAISSLTIFQAKRHSKKRVGIRDDLAEFNADEELTEQKYLEEEIFAKFLSENFALYTEKRKEGRKTIKLSEKPPWFQENESFPAPLISQQNQVAYYDFGPQFISLYKEIEVSESSTDKLAESSIVEFSEKINKFNHLNNCKYLIDNVPHLTTDNQELTNKIITLEEKISNTKKSRKYITQGILLHAAIENKNAKLNTLQYFLEQGSTKVFHELEVWSKQENLSHFVNTKRNIIDFLAVISTDKLSIFKFKKLFNLETQSYENWDNFILMNQKKQIIFLVDYKAGLPKPTHLQQITNYIEIVQKLSFSPDCDTTQTIIIGALCYQKKRVQENSTLFLQNWVLGFDDFSEQETLCLLMRKNS